MIYLLGSLQSKDNIYTNFIFNQFLFWTQLGNQVYNHFRNRLDILLCSHFPGCCMKFVEQVFCKLAFCKLVFWKLAFCKLVFWKLVFCKLVFCKLVSGLVFGRFVFWKLVFGLAFAGFRNLRICEAISVCEEIEVRLSTLPANCSLA